MKLKTLFDRFRPAAHRRVRTLPEAQLAAALASLEDASPQLAAIMDQLHGQVELNLREAMLFKHDAEACQRFCTRAAAVLDSIELLEQNRLDARERARKEAEQ